MAFQISLHYHNKIHLYCSHQMKCKGFESCEPGTVDEDQIYKKYIYMVIWMSGYIFFVNHNIATIDRVAYKQKKYISQSSGGWEVQDQGTGKFSVWWEPDFWFRDGCLLALTSQGRRVQGRGEFSGVSFRRALIPSWRFHPYDLNTRLKGSTSKYHHTAD